MKRKRKPVLDSLGLQIKDHWKEHRPRMYRGLEEAGLLDQSVYEAQERTGEALAEQIEAGVSYQDAWEAIREEWAFLPAEADEEPPDSDSPSENADASTEPNPLFPDEPPSGRSGQRPKA